MSSPYPRDVEHGTLDEELHDIRQAREALSRLKSSNDISLTHAESMLTELSEVSDTLSDERRENAIWTACRESMYGYSEDNDLDIEDSREEMLSIIRGDSLSMKNELVSAVKEHLPRDYEYEFDEDEIIDTLEDFLESGDY